MNISLYIHIPFCRRKCPYCDFYSIPYDRTCAAEYVDALCLQVKDIRWKIKTVYIGGGTPSILDRRLLDRLLTALSPVLSQSKESTIEANPESLDRGKCELFLEKGINRISIGVQSLRDSKLKFMERVHSARTARRAVLTAKEAGFCNISIDAIYGLPGESPEEWKEELRALAALDVQHMSCYSLTCEKETRFYGYRKKIDDERVAGMYLRTMRFLSREGFRQYEVSNYARRGYYCRHNKAYWENGPYLGLGAAAVSYIDGRRSRNVADACRYARAVREGKNTEVFSETLDPLRRAGETASMNIRRRKGIVFSEFRRRTGMDFYAVTDRDTLEPFFEQGIVRAVRRKGEIAGIALTEKGFLFADEVCAALV